jgi:type I site-specific restriction endonuclease
MSDDFFGEVIFYYTRAQAIKDGVLVDVSKLASEAGFKYPVAVTQGVRDSSLPSEFQPMEEAVDKKVVVQ